MLCVMVYSLSTCERLSAASCLPAVCGNYGDLKCQAVFTHSGICIISHAFQILVVEKDAIFQRLAEDRLWEVLPCVLITAKGFPDLATRAFLHKVGQA
jgi:DNA topoisomerase VI subunit A